MPGQVRGATETMRPTVSHDWEDDGGGNAADAASAAAGGSNGNDNGGNPLGFNIAWLSLLSLSFFLPPCLICRLEFTHYDRYHRHVPTTLTF